MKAKDIMTTPVLTVGRYATVPEIARIMLERHVSGLPVVDEGMRVLGVVSEGDLVRRTEIGTDQRRRSWWLEFLADPADLAREYVKTHGLKARDVMTAPAIAVGEDASLSEIAETLEKHHIKRVPVVRDGRLVGIVSRANIVQLVAAAKRLDAPVAADDETIRRRVVETLAKQPWARLGTTNITANAGVVEFWGFVDSEEERVASRVAAEAVAGVKKIVDHRALRPMTVGV
jgi:CBS domain-containing protein